MCAADGQAGTAPHVADIRRRHATLSSDHEDQLTENCIRPLRSIIAAFDDWRTDAMSVSARSSRKASAFRRRIKGHAVWEWTDP